MRTAPVGCFKFWDLEAVTKYALNFGCVTHFSEVCGVGTVAVSTLIAKQIWRASSKPPVPQMGSKDVYELVERAVKVVAEAMGPEFDVGAHRDEFDRYLHAESFEQLEIGKKSIGHVLKVAGAAALALRMGLGLERAIEEAVRWAGDADTNGAIVGGVVGAAVGFSRISPSLMKYLY